MKDIHELIKALLESRVSVVPEYSSLEDQVLRYRIIVMPPRAIGEKE